MKPISCPLVDWYLFHRCAIKTCKNFTAETKHHCLEVDRKKPDGLKQFSDAELNLYKFKSKGVSTRLIQMKRKEAVDNVKAIIILKKYIEWISETFKPDVRPIKTPTAMRELQKEYPLKIRRLGWKSWMWQHFLNKEVWKQFVVKTKGDVLEFNPGRLLRLEEEQYKHLHSAVNITKRKIKCQ